MTYKMSGSKVEGDYGEIVSLKDQTSLCSELREKLKVSWTKNVLSKLHHIETSNARGQTAQI